MAGQPLHKTPLSKYLALVLRHRRPGRATRRESSPAMLIQRQMHHPLPGIVRYLTKKEIQMLIASLMNDANTSNGHSTLYDKLSTLEKVCTCRENITADNDYLDSLSEGYDTKVDALVDSMGVTDKKVSTTYRRKDMDLL